MKTSKHTIIFDLFGVVFSKGFESSREQLVKLFDKKESEVKKSYVKRERLFDLGDITEYEFWNNINLELKTKVNPYILTETIIRNYKINPDVVDLIKCVAKHNHVVIYSNFRKIWFDLLDKKHKISNLVDEVFISSETKILKPDEAVFTFLGHKFKKPVNKFILIDDNDKNVKSADSAGACGIKFNNIFEVKPILRNKIARTLKKL